MPFYIKNKITSNLLLLMFFIVKTLFIIDKRFCKVYTTSFNSFMKEFYSIKIGIL